MDSTERLVVFMCCTSQTLPKFTAQAAGRNLPPARENLQRQNVTRERWEEIPQLQVLAGGSGVRGDGSPTTPRGSVTSQD